MNIDVNVVADDPILTSSIRIESEPVPVALIVKGIQSDDNVIVGTHAIVSAHIAGHDLVGLGIPAPNGHVDVVAVVGDAELRLLIHRLARSRAVLNDRSPDLRIAPRFVIQDTIDLRGSLDSERCDLRLVTPFQSVGRNLRIIRNCSGNIHGNRIQQSYQGSDQGKRFWKNFFKGQRHGGIELESFLYPRNESRKYN